MTLRGRSWVGVAVIVVHNLEEGLTAPAWLSPRLGELSQRFGIVPLAADAERFYVGLTIVTLASALWVAIASRGAPHSARVVSLMTLFGIFLINAFVPHIAGTIILREYVPGVISAVGLVGPFCAWHFNNAVAERWVDGRELAVALGLAVVFYVPAFWAIAGLPNR
jgi:hypothetical protein